MIFGDYPCCGGALCLTVPDKTPVFEREECPHCGAVVWHFLSRLDPVSYTEKEFLAQYDVDAATKKITKKARAA